MISRQNSNEPSRAGSAPRIGRNFGIPRTEKTALTSWRDDARLSTTGTKRVFVRGTRGTTPRSRRQPEKGKDARKWVKQLCLRLPMIVSQATRQ